jgi:hypothetical protein
MTAKGLGKLRERDGGVPYNDLGHRQTRQHLLEHDNRCTARNRIVDKPCPVFLGPTPRNKHLA